MTAAHVAAVRICDDRLMILCGITGGIGMGKSTFAKLLRTRGLPVIDTDVIARELMYPGSECVIEISDRFGTWLLDGQGGIDRSRLGEIVFNDPARMRVLESILHPRIRKTWTEEVTRWRDAQMSLGFVEIPLLFETHCEATFNRVICVACSRWTQMSRLRARGCNEEQIEARISAQWPIEKKVDMADYMVWTDVALSAVESQANRLIGMLEAGGRPVAQNG